MMHLIIKLFMILLIAGLTACASQNIVNKIEIVCTIGFDTVKNGVRSTALISKHSRKGQADLQLLDIKFHRGYSLGWLIGTLQNCWKSSENLRIPIFIRFDRAKYEKRKFAFDEPSYTFV